MNNFEQKLKDSGYYPLKAKKINSIVLSMGHKCNLACTHCYVGGSPESPELTPLSTIDKVLGILSRYPGIITVNVTGGSPELNPHFRHFIKSAADMGKEVIVSSNLTLFSGPEMEDLPEFLAGNRVTVLTSLPCATEETVDKQRGKGTFKKIIPSLKRLNELGYGKGVSTLELDIIYNPVKTSLAPSRQFLENAFKDILQTHGVTFNHLYTLNNMPLGRLRKSLSEIEVLVYLKELEEKFNPDVVGNVMCRSSIAFGPFDESCYDCDFKRMQKIPITIDGINLDNFNYEMLSDREITSTPLCFGCTAAAGLECCAAKL